MAILFQNFTTEFPDIFVVITQNMEYCHLVTFANHAFLTVNKIPSSYLLLDYIKLSFSYNILNLLRICKRLIVSAEIGR